MNRAKLAVVDSNGYDEETQLPPVDGGGDGPQDDRMRERVATIEALLPTLATKADISDLRTSMHEIVSGQKTWIIGTIITLFLGFAGLFYTMQSSLTAQVNATKATPPVAAAPQIIIVPQYGAPPAAGPYPNVAPIATDPNAGKNGRDGKG